MRTSNKLTELEKVPSVTKSKKFFRTILPMFMIALFIGLGTLPASAHCDSYDGPTVQDAMKALETNNVDLVLKWIDEDQEGEVIGLFHKTYSLRGGDPEIYSIVEKHFLETLVRLHRETEGAPFTGLKPAGTTKKIVQLSDNALTEKNVDDLLEKLNGHIGTVLRDKYQKVAMLEPVKDNSSEKGREYVEAYVDYTHSIEALHDILEGGAGHHH